MSDRTIRSRDERGSLAIEMAMIAPGLLLIFALIFAYGRAGQVNGSLESGTRDAARSVTLARSYDEALDRAKAVMLDAIKDTPQSCQDSMVLRIVGDYEPGEPVTVSTECTYDLSDLGLPGAPGTLTAKSSFTSMLDPYRGIQ
ncbi:MAG TPA: TadE family protein [Marmoricola sp.]|nr:TadE family protein [Marmoricola sp.]